ncbi:CoA transferase [Orrella sp. NBD-18]|uniref:CoA transferase n=1 Tax=Sheuella amnicola TaxID=2707330 RepID=A0A6B2R2C7_9BURK|nr:CaiB/BaiF CoA-transferase family protein [Sheuella amnicola]NDY83794.1 CoA transferase [Sheuella amnicola]
MTQARQAPLTGIRILDLSRVLAGPWCTQNLADLGADVIKVERPKYGDDTRAWGPPFLKDEEGHDTTEAAYYLSANRNKRSIEVDIASPEGIKLIKDLAKYCDILVENFKVGGLQQYGLDYGSLKDECPHLIYCSITGFGQTGPFAERPGYDFMIQGMGGLMSITGERDGLPGAGPQKAGVAVTDIITGMYASLAIMAALQERQKSGLGQHLDIALLDSHIAMLANQPLNFMTSGVAPTRAGNAHQNVVPYQVFKTSDGFMIVAVGNDSQFRSYCQAIGKPELGTDPKFATNSQRIINRDELIPMLEKIMATGERDAWIAKFESAGVPCGPIQTIDQVFSHPQVIHRGIWQNIPHPLGGTTPTTASPMRFSATPVEYRRAPPTLGQHTEEILQELANHKKKQ